MNECHLALWRRYYYSHNTGLQAQSVLYTQTSLQAQPEEFLDPNKWSSDGTVALCDYAFTKDGEYMAYSTGRCVCCFVRSHAQYYNRHLIASADSQS